MYNLIPSEQKRKSRRPAIIVILSIALIIASAVLLVALPSGVLPTLLPVLPPAKMIVPTTPEPTPTADCRADIAKYQKDTFIPFMKEWVDAFALAGSTPRLAMAQPIATMQEISRRLRAVEPVPCAIGFHTLFTGVMDDTIDDFLAHMAGKPESEVMQHLRAAESVLNILMKEAGGQINSK